MDSDAALLGPRLVSSGESDSAAVGSVGSIVATVVTVVTVVAVCGGCVSDSSVSDCSLQLGHFIMVVGAVVAVGVVLVWTVWLVGVWAS